VNPELGEGEGVQRSFLVHYAASKDTLRVIAGTAHVSVVAKSEVEARLIAEQMVAACGLEPIACELERTCPVEVLLTRD
jgi:hypothetical protein